MSKGGGMQVLQSDYFEMVGAEAIKEAVVRDKFGIESWQTCTFQSLAYVNLRFPLREENIIACPIA